MPVVALGSVFFVDSKINSLARSAESDGGLAAVCSVSCDDSVVEVSSDVMFALKMSALRGLPGV